MKRFIYSTSLVIFSICTILAQNCESFGDSLFYGIFEEGLHHNLSKVDSYSEQLQKKPSMLMWYVGWWDDNILPFPLSDCKNTWDNGYLPHVVWEPWVGLDAILAGRFDAQIEQFGRDMAEYGNPVMIRWGHEFNGDWYPWSYENGQLVPAEKWIRAFQYVHDKIILSGGNNAIWLWSPNCGNGSNNKQVITEYYPGDEYVDWIAIDGYNWGTSQSWSNWASFSDVFKYAYDLIFANFPDKPIMLGEFGCASTGGDKAAWIEDMFHQLETNFKQIKAFIWFNVNKETDWRFNANEHDFDAFYNGLKADNFSGSHISLFQVHHSECVEQHIALVQGWNLVSLYVNTDDMSASQLFPNASVIKTFDRFYRNNQLEFLNTLQTIETGTGYLLYNEAEETITVSGSKALIPITGLKQGWNLIGCTSTQPISELIETGAVRLIKDFESFWMDEGIQTMEKLKAGKAYYILK